MPDDWSEAEGIRAPQPACSKAAPAFAVKASAEDRRRPAGSSGQVAILSTIAGRGLEYAIPWADCTYKRELLVARRLATDLLESWNMDYELVDGMLTPQHLLHQWLGLPAHDPKCWPYPRVPGQVLRPRRGRAKP